MSESARLPAEPYAVADARVAAEAGRRSLKRERDPNTPRVSRCFPRSCPQRELTVLRTQGENDEVKILGASTTPLAKKKSVSALAPQRTFGSLIAPSPVQPSPARRGRQAHRL